MATVGRLVDTEKGLADRRIFYDQEIYQQELEQIFGRCWLWVGHESQIPKPNDFIANYMAEDPVLITRDAKGKVHTFLNMCRHRGNRICRADAGNAPSFMCTYHGWTFATDGKLVGVPGYKEAYFEELDRSQWGLVEAPTDLYKGLIFANWDSHAPSLLDYLGDAAWYMDLWLDRRDGGTELLPGAHRWVMNFNWKFGSDNFGGDGYHTRATHLSMSLAGYERQRTRVDAGDSVQDRTRASVYAGNGHCVLSVYTGSTLNPQAGGGRGGPIMEDYLKSIVGETERRLGKVRGLQSNMGIGTIFPSLTWHGSPLIRAWHPRGPDKTEIWSYCIVDKKAPPEVKRAMMNNYVQRFGPAGNMEQDDANNWFNSTRAAKSLTARKYPSNMQMGLGHEWTDESHPGVLNHSTTEGNWRHFYGWWDKLMAAPSWDQMQLTKSPDKWR